MALTSLRPLRQRNFALIWSAALVSNIGSWMQTVALGVLVYERTGQPSWTGLVAAAAFVPMGLLSPVGGALADRLDRRRWLILTTLAEMFFAAALAVAVVTGDDPPGVLVLLAFFGGASSAIGFPAYQAIIPDLVPPEDLLGAVSLSSAQFNLGRVVGPALAGAALVSHNYGLVFGINAASFAAVVVALTLVRLPPPAEHDGPTLPLLRRIAEGARAARAEPGCRAAIGIISVVAFTASPFIALVPAMSGVLHRQDPVGVSTQVATALLVTAQGIGAVIGALVLPVLAERMGRRRVVQGALLLLPVVLVTYAAAPGLPTALGAFLVVGAVYIVVLSGLNTVVQLRAPAAARGRILSIYMMGLGLIYPVGAVIQGAIGNHIGVRAVTAAGAAGLLVVLVATRLFRPTVFSNLGDPPGDLPAPPAGEGPAVPGPGPVAAPATGTR